MTTEDNQTWHIKLREGISFHDGTQLDAEAVKINLERHMDPANGSRMIGSGRNVDTITVVDPLSLDVKLKFPWAAFNTTALVGVFGSIASPKAIADGVLEKQAVGTGPYTVVDWVPGDRVTLTKNPNYWRDGQPYLDKITFRIMLDSGIRYTSVQKGEIDVGQSIAVNELAEANQANGIHSTQTHGGYMAAFPLNNTVPGLDDARVRLAMSYALDRDVLNDVAYDGAATPNATFWAEDTPFYDDSITWPDNDMAKAKQLIAEYEAEKGPLSFEFTCYSDPERMKLAEVAVSMWEEAGIDLTTKAVQINQMVVDLYTGNYQVSCSSMGNELNDPDGLFNYFHSSSGTNWSKYNNPEMDATLLEGRTSVDKAVRQAAYTKASEILARDMPMVRILGTPWGWISRDNVSADTLPLADLDMVNLAFTD